MLYSELKPKLTAYLNSDLPKSLFWDGGFSKDITKTIEIQMFRIDNVENLRKKGIHRSSKNNLLEIMKAIDNGQFDVSDKKSAYFLTK